MAQLPLLFFPSYEKANRTRRSGRGPTEISKPSREQQEERLRPKFKALQDSFNASSTKLQQTPTGIDPDKALVLEIIGNVKDFANAVEKIEGLEWMAEIEVAEISPDVNFYNTEKPYKPLSGRLYLIMSNTTGLEQMLSLWTQYAQEPDMKFPHGQTKFRDVFLQLRDIRRWNVEDRLLERKVYENRWKGSLKVHDNDKVRFEVELWYRGSDTKRRESENIVAHLIEDLGGSVISKCDIQAISYHAILGEIEADKALAIIDEPEVALIECESIMFFRPVGQLITGEDPVEGDISDCSLPTGNSPTGDPFVAVLDGLPLENHKLLADRLIIDDPDNWASKYPAIDRQHGTAMASLVVHGDLGDASQPLSRPVYVRPIFRPISELKRMKNDPPLPLPEVSPENVLAVDHVHKTILRIKEVAPTVGVINLSIGIEARHFLQVMSPLARLLDWLSVKYNVLFIISSGNHAQEIDIGLSESEFNDLAIHEREALVTKKLYEDKRHRRLLSPAESINGLTVGALHQDSSIKEDIEKLVDVFESTLPSPVSAFGSGYRKAIKPDFLYSGGRVLYRFNNRKNPKKLELLPDEINPLGNEVATPGHQVGELNKTKFLCGSSNAAALTSRAASMFYDYIAPIFSTQDPEGDFSAFSPLIVKAMLVHGCSWGEVGKRLESSLKDGNGEQIKNIISKWIGYGVPDFDKVLGCHEQRATLLGYGKLSYGEAYVYTLPLPPSLNAQVEKFRLTVTLAWFSPIASTTQLYRKAQLWFDFYDGEQSRRTLEKRLHLKGVDCDGRATRRGTVQHEVFESQGKRAITVTDGDNLKIKVNCRQDAQKFDSQIAYGLIVSLEVAEGVDLPIYNEIRTLIQIPVKVLA